MIEIIDLNHVTIISRDVEISKRFYCGVLNMEEVELPPAFTHATTWFRKGNAEIHLVALNDASQQPGDSRTHTEGDRDVSRSRHLALAVKDLSEAERVLSQNGIDVVLGPRPRGDGVYQLFCYDPDGHLVELHTLP